MKKIIHISDTHYGIDSHLITLKEMVDKVIAKVGANACDYIIVHTGDIVHNIISNDIYAEDRNLVPQNAYALAKAQLDRLKLAGFKLLLVPGNHDYGSGSVQLEKYEDLFSKCFYGQDHMVYPKVDIVDNIAFIGIDSIEGEIGFLNIHIGADGKISKKQLARFKDHLHSAQVQACEYKIVYMHHDPRNPGGFIVDTVHGLNDVEDFVEAVNSVNFVIHGLLVGHTHEEGNSEAFKCKCPRLHRIYGAQSSTGKNLAPDRITVIDLENDLITDLETGNVVVF